MASVTQAAAAVSAPHNSRLLLPSSPRRLPRPRPRPRARLRLASCHADTLLPSSSSSGARTPPTPAAGPSTAADSATDGFFDWLRDRGLPLGKVAIRERPVSFTREGKDLPLRYVAAGEDLQAGDVAFEVPMSLVVTLERVLGDESVAELLTTNKLSELACLALYLMYEKKQGKDSFWYPYIKELDRQRGRGQLAVESPLLWTESELDYLNGSPMREEVVARYEGIRREYNELDTLWFMAGSLFQQYPFDIPTEAFPFEIFKQAFVAVQSCVVHLQKVSLARRFVLVPLGPPLLTYKSNCKAMLTADGDSVRLVVDRPYKEGEPLIVWCGPQPNARLLLNYGFVDEDNPYDRIMIEASLNTEDPQYQEKRMVAQRNGKLAIQNFHVYIGKERETVAEMLPYLRLGYISDPDEMQSILSSEGDTCPVSPCTERAVLDQLVGYLKSRLAGYPTTLDEDEAMLADGNLEPKKEVAARLVRMEKKMLHACFQAAIEFINALPDHTVLPCPAPFAPELK
ncbi:fructose-bisphosphate aldolase-lysine N-methyltransferase, chloroplastic-like isoform X1 [Phragmites australis]|uniref:fructose-bisphosphate aldolase-lysine N-methyltransferase, chloroplastic-like isoform X1 n=1 Tax=Phragmites australis TaxID=29695 RepID=UPI002D78074E|nr:fructose-bisphosphate aldolase-lysine N-methyltransferase, chloroplastic-like isoform X1 [Phragmites australis]XP_062203744.1 fructose-bisphosphate aldolase-lysine N-methyltransferase, chloroplastic-like isoform X1 [Phragmites australis]